MTALYIVTASAQFIASAANFWVGHEAAGLLFALAGLGFACAALIEAY